MSFEIQGHEFWALAQSWARGFGIRVRVSQIGWGIIDCLGLGGFEGLGLGSEFSQIGFGSEFHN